MADRKQPSDVNSVIYEVLSRVKRIERAVRVNSNVREDHGPSYMKNTPKEILKVFSERFRKEIENSIYREDDIVDTLDIDFKMYERFKNGEKGPNLRILCSIADLFNVTVDYLLGRTDDPKSIGKEW